ncbi:MAG: hypothetical protein ACSW8C_00825 [bacterium]
MTTIISTSVKAEQTLLFAVDGRWSMVDGRWSMVIETLYSFYREIQEKTAFFIVLA